MRRAAALLLALMALAGCGDKADGERFETPSQENGAYVIAMTQDRTFDPDKAKVPAGSIVAFRAELQGCSVESREPGGPDSGTRYSNALVPKGGEFRWISPSEAASFTVYCNLHEDKGMQMLLQVG